MKAAILTGSSIRAIICRTIEMSPLPGLILYCIMTSMAGAKGEIPRRCSAPMDILPRTRTLPAHMSTRSTIFSVTGSTKAVYLRRLSYAHWGGQVHTALVVRFTQHWSGFGYCVVAALR